MPTLWPYVLKSLTPPGHHVTILDSNVIQISPPNRKTPLVQGA
jgi:hypothetical protein